MIKPNEVAYTEIEGFMGADTVSFHHGKHHQAYATALNGLLEGTEYAEWSLDDVITKFKEMSLGDKEQGVINNAGGVANHNLYFEQFSSSPKTAPEGELLEKINSTFGSLDELNAKLTATGIGQFGSGWSWLVLNNGELEVVGTKNQDNPLMLDGKLPLIGIDVWEHAYYLDVQNLRPKYLELALAHIDWAIIEDRFNKAK